MSKSLVWQYYERGRADDNRKIETCRLCETKIKCSQSSTSGLWLHLQRSHSDEYEKLKNKSKATKEKSQGLQDGIQQILRIYIVIFQMTSY